MSGYYGRRRGYSGSGRVPSGRIGRANKRPGPCRFCGIEVPAGAGQLYRDPVTGAWSAAHLEATWKGSPVSGRWVGGCPEEASSSLSAPREAPRDNRGGYIDECGSCGMASCSC